MTNIHQRYQTGINAINDALKKYHTDMPDGDSEMARKLIATKRRWTELYKRIKAPVALLEEKVKP